MRQPDDCGGGSSPDYRTRDCRFKSLPRSVWTRHGQSRTRAPTTPPPVCSRSFNLEKQLRSVFPLWSVSEDICLIYSVIHSLNTHTHSSICIIKSYWRWTHDDLNHIRDNVYMVASKPQTGRPWRHKELFYLPTSRLEQTFASCEHSAMNQTRSTPCPWMPASTFTTLGNVEWLFTKENVLK